MKSAAYVAAVTGVYSKCVHGGQKAAGEDIKVLKGAFLRGDAFTRGLFAEETILNPAASNDNVHQNSSQAVLEQAKKTFENQAENRKAPVFMELWASCGDVPVLAVRDQEGRSAEVRGDAPCEAAKTLSLTPQRAKEQLSKTGQTPFWAKEVAVHIGEGVSVPASALNALRRKALAALYEKRAEGGARVFSGSTKVALPDKKPAKTGLYFAAQVKTLAQARALIAAGVDRLYVPKSLYKQINFDEKYAVLPLTGEAGAEFFPKVLAENLGAAYAAKAQGAAVVADYRFNVFNTLAANELPFDGITLSGELTLSGADEIASGAKAPCEAVVYGALPLMVTGGCVLSAARGKCTCQPLVLTDGTGAAFPVEKGEGCHSLVYNSRPIFLADKMYLVRKTALSGVRLLFTDEEPARCAEILAMYQGKILAKAPKLYTRGHFFAKKERQV